MILFRCIIVRNNFSEMPYASTQSKAQQSFDALSSLTFQIWNDLILNPPIIDVVILREIGSFKYITKSFSTFWKVRIRHQTKYGKILFGTFLTAPYTKYYAGDACLGSMILLYLCEIVRDCCMQKQNMYVVVEKRNLAFCLFLDTDFSCSLEF